MLTAETRKRIDTCRDILVGKLPDPKSQVLQITNALIYKFMDDQDRLAETLGGKPSFFINGLKPYAWHKVFDAKLTNQEKADKYIEGIEKLSKAEHLPELFREIFKEAYVPFRAANVITLFISEINKFDYTHSEELGNAYEYLLSIMGSQGDAGQFRTPRHIIEFLVDVVDPQKGESIYDPAAGTAGFLIAAYNHIIEANEKLSASEKRALAKNISGVDISPDMAKMARVNLYLHGFATPNILEGDTLTDEPLWGKKYDVILANPPFMSPKGGIQPHDKFSIKAKRSEVLFVDYIAEHLKLKGRAGVIVPEGIIFQSGTAYKQLRKMLVDDGYLHTVISLPAGIFQPYAGVKTSILILDRERAKETDEILFLKIEKDGYSLSTQRTRLCNDNGEQSEWCPNHSDLPAALKVAKAWRDGKKQEASVASWVSKETIAASVDYTLTADRYRNFKSHSSEWPYVELGDQDYFSIESGGTPSTSNDDYWNGDIPWVTLVDLPPKDVLSVIRDTERKITSAGLNNSSAKLLPPSTIVVSTRATIGRVGIATRSLCTNQGFKNIIVTNTDAVAPRFVAYMVKHLVPQMESLASGGTFKELSKTSFSTLKIPLPPIDMQKELVGELDRYQKIVDGARQVMENYRPTIEIDPEWPVVKLEELCGIEHGFAFKGEFFEDGDKEHFPILLTPGNFAQGGGLYFTRKNTKRYSGDVPDAFRLGRGDLVVVMTDLSPQMKILGMPAIIDGDDFLHNQRIGKVVLKSTDVIKSYLRYAFLIPAVNETIKREATGSTVRHTSPSRILSIEIPLPSISAQQQIVAKIEDEEALVDANHELIKRFEAKIQATIDRVWVSNETLDVIDRGANEEAVL
ncbi:MAG: N-6 DNA methylase [Hyphomicrobiaceae bacterium]